MNIAVDTAAGGALPLSDDEALELEIETARLAATNAKDPEIARAGFEAMAALVAMRSPEQIERMEAKLPKPWGQEKRA
jgi:hypothetical protein